MIHEVVFAAPECSLAAQYIQWCKEQDVEGDHVRTKTLKLVEFERIHGQHAVRLFLRNMTMFGHPYQPVREVRDSRNPVVDTLDNTLAYVSP